jgi:alkaline phosphatase D
VAELDRRTFLAGIGALTVVPRLTVAPRAQPSPAPFSWGVASFDPTTSGVLLWTRVTPPDDEDPVPVEWVLAADEGLAELVDSGSVSATADNDFCVRVDVTALPAGGTWWYAFTTPDGTRSPIGRTRTLTTEPERVRLAVASCGRFATAGFAAYRALAGRELDVVVHVGDYIYEDGRSDERSHEPDHRCMTLADYRERYAQYRADPDLQSLHARHPMVAVGDDHEVAGNAWRDGAADHDDDDRPWLDRLVDANRAHEEWLPGRTDRGPDGRLKAWRSIELGDLAELVVLDTRAWGRDLQPASGDELLEERTMLGADQEEFVAGRLTDPDRRPWVVLANQVMFHPLRLPALGVAVQEAVRDRGFLVVDETAVNPDQWDGYPLARQALLDAVGPAGGVVMVTGDFHSSWGWELSVGPNDDPSMLELVAPSITSSTFADRIPISPSLVETGLSLLDGDLAYVELDSHGYLLVELTEADVQAEWWYVDPSDPATQRFGAARRSPRLAPMRMEEVTEPRPDAGAPPTAPTAPAATVGDDDDSGGDLPVPLIGGAAAVLGAAALAMGRRRRMPRRHPAYDDDFDDEDD